MKIFFIGPTHGNVQNEWKQLGYLESLSIYETDYLKRHCQPELSVFYVEAKNNELVIETHIAAQEIQGIVVAEVEIINKTKNKIEKLYLLRNEIKFYKKNKK